MTATDWPAMDGFSASEKWGDPYRMDYNLIAGLVELRRFVSRPIIIHCGYEPRKTGGYHPTGRAVDCHIEGMHVIDQYLAAQRFDTFNGIGFYTWWDRPGLHLDTRPEAARLGFDARWCSRQEGRYEAVTAELLAKIYYEVG